VLHRLDPVIDAEEEARTRGRPVHVDQDYLRADTIAAANAAGIAVRGASLLREELVLPQRTTKDKGREVTHSLPLSMYSTPGGLWQDPGRAAESPAEASTCGNQGFTKCVCSCRRTGLAGRRTAGGLAMRLRVVGAKVRVCGPPDCTEQLAEMQSR
jgi:hypothetical protein